MLLWVLVCFTFEGNSRDPVISHHFVDMNNVSDEMKNAIQKRVNMNLVCEFILYLCPWFFVFACLSVVGSLHSFMMRWYVVIFADSYALST